ncbi:hypothetical protein ACIQJT_03315 [Streptomyces sp. NPDC091972]|uniref:hypothetical protein n=1 Tax=Streptomyces sp. NPDC091972 TaxID=3366007 RepID=UPI00382F221C
MADGAHTVGARCGRIPRWAEGSLPAGRARCRDTAAPLGKKTLGTAAISGQIVAATDLAELLVAL